MARPEPLKLGPFSGGLNLLADPQNIDDSELTECINFEVDIDGSLMCRPAIIETVSNGSNSSDRMRVIGRANFSAGGDYLIASNDSAIYSFDGEVWTLITNVSSDCALQYNDNVYVIATEDSANNGGRWDGTTWTADASMPRGRSGVFHKSRLYVVPGYATATNPSRLTFSDTITSTTLAWTGSNIIDVSPGDGENLVDVMIYNDNLVLFKSDSIYLLAYDIEPADAVLRKIHASIGVNRQFCVDEFDNSIFFIHEGNVWEMENYEFTKINQKVPFVLDQVVSDDAYSLKETVWLRRVGERLLVGFHVKRYSYHLLTKAWSEWQVTSVESAKLFGPPMEIVKSEDTNAPTKYYMGSTAIDLTSFFYVTDKYVEGTLDNFSTIDGGYGSPTDTNIECSMQTKQLDFDLPFSWKKLAWWGVHANTGTTVQGKAIINNVTQTNDTWEEISLYTWDTLPGTWDSVLNNFTVVDDITVNANSGASFYKFQKGMRFRTISFKVLISNDGNTAGGPCRLFTFTAIVGLKQTVGKDIN